MNYKLFVLLILGCFFVVATGCYSTLDERTKLGVPGAKDTIQSRYERPVDQIVEAAKTALSYNGTLTKVDIVNNTLEAKIDTRTVWVKVDEVEPGVSRVRVQARDKLGTSDIDLASEIDKQIALRLR